MKLIIDIDEKDLNYPANILYAVKHSTPIPDNATVCDIDAIRDEIADLEEGISSYHNDRPWVFKDEVLRIIDKHTEGR